jgi:2-methylisocitrate lyase-like PEP mutase family enzyme/predicted thioesterase
MARSIPLGARAEAEEIVEFKHTLAAHHPALPPVYSTPNMIRLMERATFLALQPYSDGDEISVGTAINIQHRAASGIGSRIKAEAVLESFDGRFYTLRVSARNGSQEIGQGTVSRAIVNAGKFQEKFKIDNASRGFGGLEEQKKKAEAFRAMHHGAGVLVLPNAWDVASARIFEEAGFGAIATTSAGVAFSLGYPDGQRIPRDEMLGQVGRIARAVRVPVTADVEAGYGNRPEDAAQTARGVLTAGAVGLNLEDASGDLADPLIDLSLQLEKIRAMRETAESAGVPLVLNARTDVYLLQVRPAEKRYDEALRRLSAFRDAGADCLFVPGLRDAETISRLVRELNYPVNILGGPGSPAVPELQKLDVKRVSVGSGPMRATLGQTRKVAEELKSTGTYRSMEAAPSHADANRLLS